MLRLPYEIAKLVLYEMNSGNGNVKISGNGNVKITLLNVKTCAL